MGHAFDAGVPDFLVELGVETDVFGVLVERLGLAECSYGGGWRFGREKVR